MKCILLCAGYATRLHPLTLNTSKSLLNVAGKPLIEHILDKIECVDIIDEILIVTNNKFCGEFEEWNSNYTSSKRIKIINDFTSSNEDRLGAVGDIVFVLKQRRINEDVLVVGGDNLFDFNLNAFANFFKEKKSSVVALYDVKNLELAKLYGVVSLDGDNKMVDFEEKPRIPKSTLASTACYIFAKDDIAEILDKTNERLDRIGDFIKKLSSNKSVYGYTFDSAWLDIGSKKQLEEANKSWGK